MRTRWIVALGVTLSLAGAGCGSGAEGTPTGSTATGSPGVGPTGSPTGEPPGPTVTISNFAFDPNEIDAAPGSTLTLRNTDPTTPHTFTVEVIDVTLDPMSSTEVTVDLGPGEYRVICRFHEGKGMTATLRVESI